MDNSVITIDGEIVLVKVNKVQGFYIQITEVIPDPFKKGWWMVKFYPLVLSRNFKLKEASWKLDEKQIRGEEFTISGTPHQLFKVEYEETVLEKKQNADSPVPLPKPKLVKKPDQGFFKTELMPSFNNEQRPERTFERSYLRLVK